MFRFGEFYEMKIQPFCLVSLAAAANLSGQQKLYLIAKMLSDEDIENVAE